MKGDAMRWITRKNANVDRIACPWLIKRFVDEDAEFIYVPADDVRAEAARLDAIPYDIPDVELGHVDGRCSFESIILKYDLHDPALDLLAKLVHGADVPADLPTSPVEAHGLRAMAYGFAYLHGDQDHHKIALETPVYDAFYAWCQKQVESTA
jgi:hypothetical protein